MHKTATSIVGTLQDQGFEAYLVGGCVRDLLLGEEPQDYDIATNATPDQIEVLFPKTRGLLGKVFGVMLLEQDGHHFEVATFRQDSDYIDGRRPSEVHFSTAEQDALRRDFTINGIFYNPCNDEYHDFVGGKADLARGLLRFIGTPNVRVQEDFLRLLRAVRFKHRFNLSYDHNTGAALKTHAALVTQIVAERVLGEMNKIIVHKSRAIAFCDLFELGILAKLFPEVEALAQTLQPKDHHSEGDVLTHTFLVLQNMPENEDLALYWAAFFHDYAKARCKHWDGEMWSFPGHDQLADDMVKPLLKRLKFPNKLANKILWLLRYKAIFDSFWEMKLSKRLHYYDKVWFEDLLKLERADLLGCIPEDKSEHQRALERLDLIHENWEYAHRAKLLPSSHAELLSGEDIMALTDIPAGPQIGKLKKQLRELQMEGEIKNKGEAREWLKTQKSL